MPALHRTARVSCRQIIAVSILVALASLLGACGVHPRPYTLAAPEKMADIPEIQWCGTLKLPGKWLDGTPVGGLSDIGWDQDESLLYAVSDRGWLHRLRLAFRHGELIGAKALKTYTLRDETDISLQGTLSDAEGMQLLHSDNDRRGDTRLAISFEQQPRVEQFLPSGLAVHEPISPNGARGAAPNHGMEALALHPQYGLIAGLESTPENMSEGTTRLFTVDGKYEWTYPLASDSNSSLTAMEMLPDGDMLMLERAFSPPFPLIISLRRAHLGDPGTQVEVRTLARLSTGEGWSLDNFEGLTRINGNRFLMISDDNFSSFQTTLLSCFAVIEPEAFTHPDEK
ncbi:MULTISPECIES: esterase-like activity of phytase family protein [Cobetia]|uniref:Esterase-like activity of phytase family protein n=1 Tax=Cobetia crustatorum TaxID=553385 RepID=A0A558HSH6_9GAMM|nr:MULTISPECIES: esterase-like activity of phytase family protein [Cobetia]TVU72069.1 esterase-like activity of phytase family protein [Cobetia crustatorum]